MAHEHLPHLAHCLIFIAEQMAYAKHDNSITISTETARDDWEKLMIHACTVNLKEMLPVLKSKGVTVTDLSSDVERLKISW